MDPVDLPHLIHLRSIGRDLPQSVQLRLELSLVSQVISGELIGEISLIAAQGSLVRDPISGPLDRTLPRAVVRAKLWI